MRVPKHGRGKLRVGGTNKGGPGRPPDEFKKLCQQLACSAAEAAARVLGNPDHPAFIGALKWATEHGYGRPAQTVVHTGEDGGPMKVEHTWRFGTKDVTF